MKPVIHKLFSDYRFAAILAGILTEFSNIYINFFPAWICFVPLFMVLQKEDPKKCFRAGFIFGLTMSIISLYWIIPGAERFTGNSSIYGIIVFLISSAVMSLYFASINYCFRLLKQTPLIKFSYLLNAILIACIYVIGEAILTIISTGMPWFGFHSGTGLLSNVYAIQPAAWFGIHGITFIVILINYLIAYALTEKSWKLLIPPALVSITYMAAGYFMFMQFNPKTGKAFTAAILSQNIPPEVRWDDNTGNMLVAKILNMDSLAATTKPNIILWSESAVPWTYKPDDDLVNELLKITASNNITHLLGINTDYADNEVYNSVYSLLPNGTVAGRYDKRFLLSFIEEGLGGLIIPFFSSSGFIVKKGASAEPLNTPYGKAGVMICNESTVPSSAGSMVKNGAEFLVNLSNDGWFSNTYLVDLHFYNVRLRAVETRKDIAINSNDGYSGLVSASGNIAMKERSNEPFIKTITISPNQLTTLAVSMPSLMLYCCSGFLLLFIVKSRYNIKTMASKM